MGSHDLRKEGVTLMANYGYLQLSLHDKSTTVKELDTRLRKAVRDWFRCEEWHVERFGQDPKEKLWLVSLHGSSPKTEPGRYLKAPNEDFGFVVELVRPGLIAFRHGMNSFDRWAQGCIEEMLAEAYGVGIYYDATDKTYKPGSKRYRVRRRYGLYMARNFKKPLSQEDLAYFKRFEDVTPKGWW